jgi:hypothetical protein
MLLQMQPYVNVKQEQPLPADRNQKNQGRVNAHGDQE